MKKAIGTVFVCLALAVSAAVVLKDGVYKGRANGYKGPVHVEVTVKEGKISAVKVMKCQDRFARRVVKEIPRRIVEADSTEVDVISGATVTSRAVQKAVRNALEGAQ